MDFVTLTDAQAAVSQLADDFARKEILPHVESLEKAGQFPKEIFNKAIKAGLMHLPIPEVYGGGGMGYLEFVMVTEKLSWACTGVGVAISLNTMLCDVLMVGGSEEQKKKYLPRLTSGEVAGYGLTEPGAGSDTAGIRSTAVKKGNKYILNGTKTWISNSPAATFFIVFAKTDLKARSKSVSAFIVERNAPGLRVGNNLPKMGQKAFPAAELFLENVEVPEENLIGKEGDGIVIAMKVFDRSRPMIAAAGVGLAQRCLDESVRYAKTRETMGKPIIAHQLVAQKLADMAMRIEAARLLTYRSVDLLDHGQTNTKEASMAKALATDTAAWASSEAVQVFGGMGYSPEYPVEKLYRDSKVMQIYEGTNEIQRIIIGRELAKQG